MCFAACSGAAATHRPVLVFPAEEATAAALGDVDRDGQLDLAVGDLANLHQVTLWRGVDGGSFSIPPRSASFLAYGHTLLLAPVRLDAGADLVVFGTRVYTYRSLDDGGLDRIALESDAGYDADEARVLQLDSDGVPDLAFETNGVIDLLRGGGNGLFAERGVLDAGRAPWQLDSADIDGDGREDLVSANGRSNDVTIYLSNGDFTFRGPTTLGVAASPNEVVAADLDGDHHAEVYVATSHGLHIFRTPQSLASVVPGDWLTVGAADLDGDGKRDLVVRDIFGLSQIINTGAGLPGSATPSLALGNAAFFGYWLLAADLDHDGADDLVLPLGTNVLVVRGGPAGLAAPVTEPVPQRASWVLAKDLDGDGQLDLALALEGAHAVQVRFGDSGQLGAPLLLPAGTYPRHVVAADIDSDRRLDLVVANGDNPGGVTVLLNLGGRTFGPAKTTHGGGTTQQLAVLDADGDGKPDVVAAGLASKTLDLFLGNGDGTFRPARALLSTDAYASVVAADFTGDARDDLAVGAANVSGVRLLRNDRDGGFTALPTLGQGFDPFALIADDFDRDGRPDLASSAASTSGGGNSVWLALGDGRFKPSFDVTTNGSPRSMAVADLDRDGWDELIIGVEDTVVGVFHNERDGGFAPERRVFIGSDPRYIAVGDFNGDGRIDAVASTQGFGDAGTLTLLDGTCW